MSCYYTNWQQCMTTLSGIGGNCVASPYYHLQLTPLPRPALVKPRHYRAHLRGLSRALRSLVCRSMRKELGP
jgi:hypothetical protein